MYQSGKLDYAAVTNIPQSLYGFKNKCLFLLLLPVQHRLAVGEKGVLLNIVTWDLADGAATM